MTKFESAEKNGLGGGQPRGIRQAYLNEIYKVSLKYILEGYIGW